MKRKKGAFFFLAGAVLLSSLSGCRGNSADHKAAGEGEEKVTVALWSDQLTESYGGYLKQKFPEVDFEFYVATNSTDFYRFKEERGELPDILTVRRFALKDVVSWRDSLLDLSDSELAGSFYQSYLRNYTYDDGTVNWLPAYAEVDGIIVNKEILREHNLDIPKNYSEFTDVCKTLSKSGIRPFLSNFAADYTCMELLQGLSISQLVSQEGREWRQQYESGQTNQLSEKVWMPVFERMQEFIGSSGVTQADLKYEHEKVFTMYENRETAMMRGTGDEAIRYSIDKESLLIPYYGAEEEDNWYLTYPAFQAAVNRDAENDPEREQLMKEILAAMLSKDGLKNIADGQNMIAYHKDVELELSPALAYLQPYAEENRLYIRLASSDMFSVSQQVVQGMITGEYSDARDAFNAFNEALRHSGEETLPAAHIGTGYAYEFHPDGGSRAASAVLNSLREEVGTQLLLGPAASVAGNIVEGDYTEEQLGFLTMGESPSILLCDVEGEQLYRLADYILTTPGKRGSVINDSTLYVSSGFEMEVKKTKQGYELERLTMDGSELNRTETYSLALLGNEELMMKEALQSAGITDYTKTQTTYKEIIVNRLASEGKQLAEPADYITLR